MLQKKHWKQGCSAVNELGFSRDEIRLAVREALLQALPSADKKNKPEPVAPNCQLMKQILESAKGEL